MGKKVAVRNVRLCEKDCLCLYVCPTGASDTENSVIDVEKCIGCGVCADACPSAAISLVPREYPAQQPKTDSVISSLRQLAASKAEQEQIAAALPGPLARALEMSNRIMTEDLLRESGYMLPQSGNTERFLQELQSGGQAPGFPADAVEHLLSSVPFNESIEIKEKKEMESKNIYTGTQTEKNLLAAFAGESQARNKYTYFASKAKSEGFEQISALFMKTADNEKNTQKSGLKN